MGLGGVRSCCCGEQRARRMKKCSERPLFFPQARARAQHPTSHKVITASPPLAIGRHQKANPSLTLATVPRRTPAEACVWRAGSKREGGDRGAGAKVGIPLVGRPNKSQQQEVLPLETPNFANVPCRKALKAWAETGPFCLLAPPPSPLLTFWASILTELRP
jgi:hypothetical protein